MGALQWVATNILGTASTSDNGLCVSNAEAIAYLQYTSGSTSEPKGVMVSHANVLENSRYLATAFRHTADDISLSWLPHFHDLGLVHGIVQPLYSGFPGYLMAPMSFLQRPLDWLKAISEFRITHSDGPNFAYELCVNKISDEEKQTLDLSTWRMALTGAEPVFPETMDRFAHAFARCGFRRTAFYPAYGLAEATLVVSGGKNEPELTRCSVVSSALEQNKVIFANGSGSGERTLVGSGTFAAPMEIKIVDPESKQKCSPDTVGEIWVTGPSVALGYWNRPQETEDIFKAKLDSDSHRFLRTGDLGFIHLGNVFVTGRHKELIIIRGRNYYPQDIERTAREACPEVSLGTGAAFSIPVGTEERAVLVQELQRHHKTGLPHLLMRMRQAIAEEHELQLEEIVLVKAGSVPRTSSGKIQRRLCRKHFLEGALQVIGRWQAEPVTDELPTETLSVWNFDKVQNWLVTRLAARIGVSEKGIATHRPLLHFGLDSLIAVDLAHDVQRKFGLPWPPSVFLETASITALALRAERELNHQPPLKTPAPHIREADEYPLSFGQQGLWFLHQLSPESVAYNIALSIRITSEIDVPALRIAFQALVDRHGSLRTTFASIANVPIQKVHGKAEICFTFEDAQRSSEAKLHQRLTSEAHKPFDLEHGPLFRVHLFSRSTREHLLLITAHHIILDLWSVAQLMEELGVLYRATRSGATAQLLPPSSSYFQFVAWQKEMLAGDRGHELWSYWGRQLAGELPILDLATDFVRPGAQTCSGACSPFTINAELATGLKKLSQDSGVTLYMTLLATFAVLLHRYSGQEEILVGSPTAGRTRSEFASTVGYFVNSVVVRNRISAGSSFEDFLRRDVRKSVLEALAHQDYPFALLTERLQTVRDPRRSPVFQVMFAMQKGRSLQEQPLSLFSLGETTARIDLGGLKMQPFALTQRIAQFDLTLVTAESPDGLAAMFEYNTDLFDPATISRMTACYQQLLQSIVEDPAEKISRLRLLSVDEAKQLIHACQAQPLTSWQHVPVYQLFEQQAARIPHATALIFDAQKVSYRELNELANRLAHHLIHSGVRQGTPVAVCLERSPEMVTSLLAVFKAGAVYVPLDPEYPQERLNFLLRDSGSEVVITRQGLIAAGVEKTQMIVHLDAEQEAIARESAANPESKRDVDIPAYVIYTSGSTGAPKGVLASHRPLSNHMQWLARECPLDETDRVLHKYSPSFDASLAEIFHPLITGAALVIARAGGQHDPRYLLDLILKQRVTEIDSVPAMLNALVDDERISSYKVLRRVISGGATLTPELRRYICDRLGPVELINMYGPTEATITATFHRCISSHNHARVPIGVPVNDTQVYLLDPGLQPVPVGALGEIYIGGSGLALGYLNRPHLTAERFVPDPFSAIPGTRLYKTGDLGRHREPGLLEYTGRVDRQVKLRGFRIEPVEIEQELNKHSSIQDAVVVTKARSSGEEYLAAYVQAVPGERITPSQIRSWLKTILPGHMIPAAIIVLDRLPRLLSGKPDTRSLPEPGNTGSEEPFAPPHDYTEQILVNAWKQVLGRETVSIHDNFFELGGDSILCLQVVAHAREKGLEITPSQMFQCQTIADLALQVNRTNLRVEILEATGQFFPLTPIQRWFFEQDLNELNHYSQSLLLEVSVPLDVTLLEQAIQELIIRHDALRLRFEKGEGGWQQRVAATDSNNAVKYVDLAHGSGQERQKEVDRVTDEVRTTLNVREGPTIRGTYFDLGANNPHQLFIAVHHLAIDGVSWQIILRDLHHIYEQLKSGRQPAPHSKPLGFQQWSELLQKHAQNNAVRQELGWWTTELSSSTGTIPTDYDGNNTADSSCSLRVCLPEDETRRLLHEVPRAYRTEINDVLLTALAQTLARWAQQSAVLVDLEGHGREGVIDGADPSGTVGWFTTVFPVPLKMKGESDPGERLKAVKEHLRRIPARGIGYGLLRYLSTDTAVPRKLRALPQAKVSFNYLGQLDKLCPSAAPFRILRIDGPMKTAFRNRSHVLEIDCYIKDTCLQMQWTYSSELHQQNTIQGLASDFLEELRILIEHCSSRQEAEYTFSDSPLLELNQRQLKRIQELYGPIADMHPLSPMQQGMLFHSLYEPERGTYVTQLVCEFAGDLDREKFRAAWQHVVESHSAFRSGFESEIVTEEPVQVVKQAAQPEWSFGDWNYATAQERSNLLESYLQSDRERPMDLRHAPLMRFALFAAGSGKHFFVWSSHHLLMDGWSLPIVLKEVFAEYEALCRNERTVLKPEPLYRDYIGWLKTQDLNAAEEFWRKRMRGFTAPGALQPLHRADLSTAGNRQAFCEHELRLT
ncbi:MAG: amino acid adenylation domain-containing protein, partial [Actinomycetota bacterium]